MIYCFTEHNDHEGESWDFYIEMTENQKDYLMDLILGNNLEDIFIISEKEYDLETVRILVENTQCGYMDQSNDYGKLTDKVFDIKNVDDLIDNFYKGGIGSYTTGKLL